MSDDPPPPPPAVHQRRPRYAGKHPRRFEDKYKEHQAERFPDETRKIVASGKTPAGTHRPIMVAEVLDALRPAPGEIAVDCTLGYGGHAREILARVQPRGRLIGLDVDPLELPKTEERLRALGFDGSALSVHRSNFAGLRKVLAAEGLEAADVILADLGVSSMQLDAPARGFSFKAEGPLDMRMNPRRGQPASELLAKTGPEALAAVLRENADEPQAPLLAAGLAGRRFETTKALAGAIRGLLPRLGLEERELAVRRVFQALRIAVNDEFSALESFLRDLPSCLAPGGRAAILAFHSGEDRRIKKAFVEGARAGLFSEVAAEVTRPGAAERHGNPRSAATKMRWAVKAGGGRIDKMDFMD